MTLANKSEEIYIFSNPYSVVTVYFDQKSPVFFFFVKKNFFEKKKIFEKKILHRFFFKLRGCRISRSVGYSGNIRYIYSSNHIQFYAIFHIDDLQIIIKQVCVVIKGLFSLNKCYICVNRNFIKTRAFHHSCN